MSSVGVASSSMTTVEEEEEEEIPVRHWMPLLQLMSLQLQREFLRHRIRRLYLVDVQLTNEVCFLLGEEFASGRNQLFDTLYLRNAGLDDAMLAPILVALQHDTALQVLDIQRNDKLTQVTVWTCTELVLTNRSLCQLRMDRRLDDVALSQTSINTLLQTNKENAEEFGRACEVGDLQRVRELRSLGVSVNANPGGGGKPPVRRAMDAGHAVLVQFLLQEGADADQLVTKATRDGLPDMLLLALLHGAEPPPLNSGKLHFEQGQSDVCRALLKGWENDDLSQWWTQYGFQVARNMGGVAVNWTPEVHLCVTQAVDMQIELCMVMNDTEEEELFAVGHIDDYTPTALWHVMPIEILDRILAYVGAVMDVQDVQPAGKSTGGKSSNSSCSVQ